MIKTKIVETKHLTFKSKISIITLINTLSETDLYFGTVLTYFFGSDFEVVTFQLCAPNKTEADP